MPIDSHLSYLEKHAYCPPQIVEPPHPDLRLVVVVPITSGEGFSQTFSSLHRCNLPIGAFEIIAVVFGSEADGNEESKTLLQYADFLRLWKAESKGELENHGYPNHPLHIVAMPSLPRKHAGMGLARKIGMDEAVHRLRQVGNEDGLILSIDAPNWLMQNGLERIEDFFARHPKLESAAIPAAYEASNGAFPEIDNAILKACLEADLRTIGLRQAGHPYAFPLEEAGIAVRLRGYEAQDGMNRRKFGDVFAFFQKFIEVGRHGTCWETALVQIGFGSRHVNASIGKRVRAILANGGEPEAFALDSYRELAAGIGAVSRLFGLDATGFEAVWEELPEVFRGYVLGQGGHGAILEMQRYSRGREAFMGRFFRWMDSLRTLRFLEYCAEHHWPRAPVDVAAREMREWVTGASSNLDLDGLYEWAKAEVRRA